MPSANATRVTKATTDMIGLSAYRTQAASLVCREARNRSGINRLLGVSPWFAPSLASLPRGGCREPSGKRY